MLSIPCNCCEYLFILVNYKQQANLVIYYVIGLSRTKTLSFYNIDCGNVEFLYIGMQFRIGLLSSRSELSTDYSTIIRYFNYLIY